MAGVGTADGRTQRDGGKEDAAGRCHRTSVILDITKRKVQGNPRRGETVERMVAGRRHGVTT